MGRIAGSRDTLTAMTRPDDLNDDPPSTASRFSLSPAKMAQALFTHQIRLRRGGKGLQFVLEDKSDPEGAAPAAALPPDEQAVRRMRGDLTALLDAAPGTRKVMRVLAAIENGLQRKDSRALFLFDLPLRRLEPALQQLDCLLVEPAAPGVVALRNRLLDAIKAQQALEHAENLRQPLSSFLVDHKLEVVEARPSDFDKASASWDAAFQPTSIE